MLSSPFTDARRSIHVGSRNVSPFCSPLPIPEVRSEVLVPTESSNRYTPPAERRPVPVTVVAFVNFAGAVATIIFVLTDFTGAVPRLLDDLFIISAVLACVLGWGLLRLRNWARIGTILFMAFFAVHSLAGVLGAFKSHSIVILLFFLSQLTIQAMVIAYLVHPHASDAFEEPSIHLDLK
jgi:hypothetical protein